MYDIQKENLEDGEDYVSFHFGTDFRYASESNYLYKVDRFRMLALWIIAGLRMDTGGSSRGNMPQPDENKAIDTMYKIAHGLLLCAEAAEMAAEASEIKQRLEDVNKLRSVVSASEAAEFGATLIGAAQSATDDGRPFTAIVACDVDGNWTINHKYTANKASKAAGMMAYDSILTSKRRSRNEARKRIKGANKDKDNQS